MKNTSDVSGLLSEGLKQLGMAPSVSVVSRLETYMFELKKWNRVYNLTALKSDEDIIIKHFLDSLLYLKIIPGGLCSICDAGSGAGFPGIPIAITTPGFNITLVEPSRKKCAFLRHIKQVLSLKNLEVIESRIEDVSGLTFDVVVTRALFSATDLIGKTRHLLKDNGLLVLNKGPKFEDEIRKLPSGIKYEVITIPLPFTESKRNLIKVLLQ